MKITDDMPFVVVHPHNGETLMGWVAEDFHHENEVVVGVPITMFNVRTLKISLEIDPATQQVMRGAMVGHIDMLTGPAEVLDVIPTAFYEPKGDDAKRLLAMIEIVKETEETSSAREAGIWTPTRNLGS